MLIGKKSGKSVESVLKKQSYHNSKTVTKVSFLGDDVTNYVTLGMRLVNLRRKINR